MKANRVAVESTKRDESELGFCAKDAFLASFRTRSRVRSTRPISAWVEGARVARVREPGRWRRGLRLYRPRVAWGRKDERGNAVVATGRRSVRVVGWGTTHTNRARGGTRRASSSTPPWLCYTRPGPGRSRGRPARLCLGASRDARRLGGTRALSARPPNRGRHRENLHRRKRASRIHARFSPAPRGARRTW